MALNVSIRNKNAVQSKMNKSIMKHLFDEEAVKIKIRLKFLSFVAHQTKTFLTLLQSEQPMIHILMSLALATFQNIVKLFIVAIVLVVFDLNVLVISVSDLA